MIRLTETDRAGFCSLPGDYDRRVGYIPDFPDAAVSLFHFRGIRHLDIHPGFPGKNITEPY